jgi:hypothetical protein
LLNEKTAFFSERNNIPALKFRRVAEIIEIIVFFSAESSLFHTKITKETASYHLVEKKYYELFCSMMKMTFRALQHGNEDNILDSWLFN